MLSCGEIRTRTVSREERCPECGREAFLTDPETGEVSCRRCGLVLQEVVFDQGPERRAFTSEEEGARVRVGSPVSLTQFDKGLSTTFQPGEGRLSPETRRDMRRLKRRNMRLSVRSSVNRNLAQAMAEITRLSDRLYLPPNVKEHAALIYRKALNKELLHGRSIQGIAAAAIYAACRFTRTPRSLMEIVEASTGDRKKIAKWYRLFHREFDLTMPIDDPVKLIPKIASKTGLSQRTQNLAIELLHKAKKARVDVGKGPSGMAAATLYLASVMNGDEVTQKQLARVAGVTEVTIRNRYKGLAQALSLDVQVFRSLQGKNVIHLVRGRDVVV